jgi:hypothetical protein
VCTTRPSRSSGSAWGAETVTEQQQVDEPARKEQIETDGVDPGLSNRNEN